MICFDAGNIDAVVKNIKAKHSNKTLIIAADNDQKKGEINTGLVKAEMAGRK